MFEKEKSDKYLKIVAEVAINASPEKVFEALTTGFGKWWPHTTRKDAKVVYEPMIGGKFTKIGGMEKD